MERYKNLSGDSGVVAYEINADSISIQFRDGSVYLYTSRSVGRANLERMKQLAVAGSGLTTFINREVRKDYAARLR